VRLVAASTAPFFMTAILAPGEPSTSTRGHGNEHAKPRRRRRYGERHADASISRRHGETEWSRSGRHTSITDLPLTENGKQLGARRQRPLSPEDFQLILSSPRRRARETAELAGFVGAYEPEIDNDLAEWFYGDYEGQTSKEIWKTVPGWTIWNGAVPGGETAAEVARRLDRVVARVRQSGVDQAICFGHGHALCGR
jgi:probable phosphoglycerate mutase